MKQFAQTAILAVLPMSLLAEPAEDMLAIEDIFFDDIPIVLSATRLAQPLTESPVAMTVIDREMIEASGARTIPDLLRLVPGFQVGYFDGNSPVAAYHGHSEEHSKRVQVLVDGRSVYVPSLAGIPWQDMLVGVDDIDRIEVIRGPNASTYGNNSFFAVVSIITRTAIEDQGHTIKTTLGTRDTVDTFYRYGGRLEDLDYRVKVGTQNNDGTRLLNDYTHADYLSYRLDYQANTTNNLSYQGGIKSLTKGDHEPPPDHEIDVLSAFQWFKWDSQLSAQQGISLQYYYNLHDQEEHIRTISVDAIDLGSGIVIDPFSLELTLNIKSERHDIELTHYFTSNSFRLVSGVSAREDIVEANQVFREDTPNRNKLYRAFTHGEYRFNENWLFNAGLMIEDNDISGNDASPRFALIHHINKNHTLRLGASQATRTPVLWEEYANYRLEQQLTQNGGNPLDPSIQAILGGTDILIDQSQVSAGNIKSEEITSWELGYIAQLVKNRLLLDISIFRDKTDQLIDDIDVAPPDENAYIFFGGSAEANAFINAYQTEAEGIELSIDYKPVDDLRVYAYYAYIDIDASAFTPVADDSTERKLEVSAPNDSYGLTVIKHWDSNFDIGINYFRVGEMDWMDRTGSSDPRYFHDRSAQAYEKLDIKFSKTEQLGSSKLQYALTFQNLLGAYYDYTKTRYTDTSQTAIAEPENISNFGSIQDKRFYFDLSLAFN